MPNPNSLYYHYGHNKRYSNPSHHKYDEPNLDSLEFLRRVRDDTAISQPLLIKAARYLLPYEQNIPSRYPDPPDPLSAAPDMSQLYDEFLEVVREYHKIFGGEYKPIKYYLDLISLMSCWNAQRPDDLAHAIKYYSKFLHPPEGHA